MELGYFAMPSHPPECGLKEGQDWEPMTRAQVDGARRWLHDNPDDPRAQAIREQMGLVP